MTRRRPLALAAALLVAALLGPTAQAHFPFIVPDQAGATGRLLMSETLEPDGEVDIALLAGIKLSVRDAAGKETPVTATKGKDAMSLALPGSGTRVVHGVADLGVMQRGNGPAHRLVYYTKTVLGDALDESTKLGGAVPIEIVVVKHDGGIKLKALADGKPLANKEMQVISPDGTQDKYPLDAQGCTPLFEAPGRYGAWARNWIETGGEVGGKSYAQLRHYALLVADVSDDHKPIADGTVSNRSTDMPTQIKTYAALPQAVASFGAVAADGWMYVYGGHVAERHDYSTASVTGAFHRMNLDEPTKWEKLPGAVGVQGLNLAAHGGKVYRVGGMEPRNAPGTDADNHSLSEAAVFDAQVGAWQPLPPLPVGRSSHDVAVVGDKLYVLGGWNMNGEDGQKWLDTIEVLDLKADQPKWTSIKQPFSRRALTVTVHGSKILVIGGFDENDVAHLDVDIFDTASGTWTKGPEIPGGKRNGFSPAACTLNGNVILSVATGELYQLTDDEKTWTQVAKATPRIVHRLVPHGTTDVLIVGGAQGPKMTNLVEAVTLAPASASK